MQCDFQNVTETLMRNMASSTTIYYNNLINTLFGTYLAQAGIFQFDRSTTAKLHSGAIRVSPDMSEYYLTAPQEIMCGDICELLQYIFDKPNTYKELYELVQFDDTLSVSLRKEVLSRVSPQYTDDNVLVQMIYEAVFIAVTRQYEKVGKVYVALVYTGQLAPEGKSLFSNSEYILPCKHFCGRDEELNELHELVQNNPCVIVTGIAGIGKSELVRAYAKAHKSEYKHFGYYFYKGSLKNIIANIISDPVSDEDTRYRNNLELLSMLGNDVLLIIDNFNVMPDDDESFYDLLDLKCNIIFTSHLNYDDLCVYELHSLRSMKILLELVSKFYAFEENECDILSSIIRAVSGHTYCVELFSRMISKGLYNPVSLYNKLRSGFRGFLERISATKDKRTKKKTYYDHIKDLFSFMELPDAHRDILRMLVVLPTVGVSKNFIAAIIGLQDLTVIEDLIEVGLVHEFEDKTITLHSVIRRLVVEELNPNSDNCKNIIKSVRDICVNETYNLNYDSDKILELLLQTVSKIRYKDTEECILMVHDCYKFAEQYGLNNYCFALLSIEETARNYDDPKIKTICCSDSASYTLLQGYLERAVSEQEAAVHYAKQCDDILLQANTVSTYGYYLNLADRKEKARTAMETGLALFAQLDDAFNFDRYRAVINYSDLMFSLGDTEKALIHVSAAINSLKKSEKQNTEIYGECLYSLGIYHLCLNDEKAANELYRALYFFIRIFGRDSDFVQKRVSEIQNYLIYSDDSSDDFTKLLQLLEE